MTLISHFDKLQIYSYLFPGFRNFHVLNLNCEKFKLYIQNTLNMLKTTRVYFGVLQNSLTTIVIKRVYRWHPMRALYERPCRSPICWTEVGESYITGPDLIKDTSEKWV